MSGEIDEALCDRLRRMMVDHQLAARDITDSEVLRVMGQVPRHRFMPVSEVHLAYDDGAQAIACGQTISQPYMVAKMVQELAVTRQCRVLEIGTGSGYQAAVLAALAGEVWTIERVAELSESAERLLNELGVTGVHCVVGDGTLGWPMEAPYDRILVTAGAPHVPKALVEQLAEGGRLVIPVGGSDVQAMEVIEKHGGQISRRESIGCRFVRLIGEDGWADRRACERSCGLHG